MNLLARVSGARHVAGCAVLLLGVLVGVGGCSGDTAQHDAGWGPGYETFDAARVEGQDAAISISFSGCSENAPVEVRETRTHVVVTVPESGPCAWWHERIVPLDAPLGDRIVVDGGRGDERVPLR
ncbi:MAG: hypothetical protein KY469_17805 [Actinobacteria bacterium]|nr:hypothetical protein [Actinomycetota bacterium]